MTSEAERREFSNRLQQLLHGAQYAPDSPTQLAREFNLRYSGRPITVHAARKWLLGESIPTQEKLRVLARWLAVSAEWLRFGTDSAKGQKPQGRCHDLDPRDAATIERLLKLDDSQRHFVHEMVRLLAREK